MALVFAYRGALVSLAAVVVFLAPGGGPSPASTAGALAVLAAGGVLRVMGVRHLGGRARVHTAGADFLATQGIFGRVRNPIYFGNIAFAAGAAALFASWLAAALVAAYLLGLYTVIVRYEESILLERYGASYEGYLKRVPRWLWRLSGDAGDRARDLTPWRRVAHLERWFLLSGLGIAVLAVPLSVHVPRPPSDGGETSELLGAGAALLVSMVLFAVVTRRMRRKRGRPPARAGRRMQTGPNP